MKIETCCPNPKCGKKFHVDEKLVGKRAKCKHCGTRFQIRIGVGELMEVGAAKKEVDEPDPPPVKQIQFAEDKQSVSLSVKPPSTVDPAVTQFDPGQGEAPETDDSTGDPAAGTVWQESSRPEEEPLPQNAQQQVQSPDPAATMPTSDTDEPATSQDAEADVQKTWDVGDVILDLYEVKQVHESGGMGLVYRVHHKGWNIDLAMKSPRPEAFEDESKKAAFERECETWIDLGLHPNTVSCHYVRRVDDFPRVFAEYIDGGDLTAWIREGKLYEGGHDAALERMLDVAIQFAWGLKYAHEKDLIHRDIKPDNVMMASDGTPKVTDFGLAKAFGSLEASAGASEHPERTIGGRTPAYCSPEQDRIERLREKGIPQEQWPDLTYKTDIWSWGLCILEMFIGDRTWPSGTLAPDALEGYLETAGDDDAIPKMPEGLVELLRKCFQKDPKDRPEDMAEIIEKLKVIYEQPKPNGVGEPYPRKEPKAAELLADGLNNKALSMLDLGREEEAEHLFDEALKADAHHLETTYNRGLLLWRSARITDDVFVSQMEEVRKSLVTNWRAEYLLGIVHLERGDYLAAKEVLEAAADIAPHEREVCLALEVASVLPTPCTKDIFAGRQGSGVTHVEISLDNQFALFGYEDGTLRLWDLVSDRCLRTFRGHSKPLKYITLIENSHLALSVTDNNSMRLWDLDTERCLWKCHSCRKLPNSVSISPNSRSVLWVNVFHNKEVQLTDIETGQLRRVLKGHNGEVTAVRFCPDSRFALSGSNDKTLRLWDIASGNCVRTLMHNMGLLMSVSVSPDGHFALSKERPTDRTHTDESIYRLWQLSTGHCIRTFEKRTKWVRLVTVNAELTCVLSLAHNNMIYLIDAVTGHSLWVLKGHRTVDAMAIASDGRFALSGCEHDTSLLLLDLVTGKCLKKLEGHISGISSVSISKDQRVALSGSKDKSFRLWDLKTGRCMRTMKQFTTEQELATPANEQEFSTVEHVNISPNGQIALSQSDRNTLHIRHLNRSLVAPFMLCMPQRSAELTTFREQVQRAITSANRALEKANPSDAMAVIRRIYSTPGYSRQADLLKVWRKIGCFGRICRFNEGWHVRTFKGHTKEVNCLSISPDDSLVLSASMDSTYRLWKTDTGSCIQTIGGAYDGRSFVSHISFSPDSRFALLRGPSGYPELRELATGECAMSLNATNPCLVGSPSMWICPDGRIAILILANVNRPHLFDLTTGRYLHTFEKNGLQVGSICISPDGLFALSTGGRLRKGLIGLWDLATGCCLSTYEGHIAGVSSVCWTPDGRFALSGSNDKTIRFWDLKAGCCLTTLRGHTSRVTSLSVSPDGQYALSGSTDKTLRLWELATGNCVRSFEGHSDSVTSVSFSSDGRFAISGSADSTLRFWEFLWEYDFPTYATWNENASPILENFLTLHMPLGEDGFRKKGTPRWTENDFQRLIIDLQYRGYGWLRPEGVRRQLEKMTREGTGPPLLRESFLSGKVPINPEVSQNLICSCGFVNPPSNRFCNQCGKPLLTE